MKNFKDLGIVAPEQGFTGDKIKIGKVINRPITVHDFRVVKSHYPEKGNGKCLHLQIGIGEMKHVVFTGSVNLMNTIEKINKSDFPFSATIVEENERYQFN